MIAERPEPCWVVTDPDGYGYEPHFSDRAQANAAADESPGAGVVVYRRPVLCWQVHCGRCGVLRDIEDDGGYAHVHFPDRAAAVLSEVEAEPVCEDCAAAAALGSVADPTGAILPVVAAQREN